MAGSIKEIGQRAEKLIEQGNEADNRVKSCQSMVVQSSGRVAAAHSQLARASETDEEGNPVGDVGAARRELSMAQQQLAASRRALADAESNARQIEQAKKSEVAEIQRHNAIERMNLQKLRALRNKVFGENAEMMAEGMAERLNEAEEARIELLRSMGIDATPEYVQEGVAGGGSAGWGGGGFGSLDISGQPQSFSGGGGGTAGGVAATGRGGLGNGFNGFETGMLDNGTVVLKGENYKDYIRDYYDSDSMEEVSTDSNPIVERITPEQIEGVYLSETDLENPEAFWQMHNSSKEFHIETASHIPEVEQRLAQGQSLDEIREDSNLVQCVSNYFDPDNLPRVEKWGDYYVFDGDGRHRIIAARELGYNINVRVMHTRRRR